MRLAVVPEGPLAFDGKEYLYSEGEGVYLDSLAQYFDDVEIYAYALHPGDCYYEGVARRRFEASNIHVVELPFRHTHCGKYMQMLSVAKVICTHIRSWDLIFIFLPGYPGALMTLINRVMGKKYIAYLASDWPEEARLLIPWKGRLGKMLLPLYSRWTGWVQDMTVRHSVFTLTAGTLLFQKYKRYEAPVEETVPRINWPALSLSDRTDTCQGSTKRLLFVGYLLPRKGAANVIDAFSILVQRGRTDLTLDIVGEGEQRQELTLQAVRLGVRSRITFLGHVANGPELIDIYRRSDLFVFSSYAGEGFARVLYEAMSQGLPIVATDVCGTGYKMKHEINALLVEPHDPVQIADAAERLIEDSTLRRELIDGGYGFMQKLMAHADGGRQVCELLKKHCSTYQSYLAAREVMA
jgi:glycosyltransferase involved in cell wall biosynthesis